MVPEPLAGDLRAAAKDAEWRFAGSDDSLHKKMEDNVEAMMDIAKKWIREGHVAL